MSAFGGLITTNIGRNLQAKAQLGTPLQFTRMGLGDGELGGSSILDLTALKHEVKSLNLAQFQLVTGGKAKIRTVLSNQDIISGFYWREIGIFAQDPDLGEILYCYGNAGALAEYIPAGGGADVIEKVINIITLIGNASNVSAVLDQSLAWATQQDLEDHAGSKSTHGIGDGYYIAKTSSDDQLPAYIDIKGKPESFTPSAHKNSHASGGSDAITPEDIGAAPASGVTDDMIGSRTISDATAPTGDTGKPTTLFGWLAYMIKSITGKSSWRTAPVKSIEQINTEVTSHLADYTLQVPFAAATGSANTYAVTLNPAPSALVDGLAFAVKINMDSTGASTVNVNSLGAKTIKKPNGNNMTTLKAESIYTLRYNGTNFIVQGEGASGNATASDLLSGKTASTDAGEITGTMPNNGALGTITPGTTNQSIPAGYTSGGTVAGDADLIAANIKAGINIFGVAGNSNVVDTSAGDATAAQILNGKKAYVDGALVTGNIPSKGAATITPGTTNQTIAAGQYLTGIQTISGDADLIAGNIKSGVNIFGVAGTLAWEPTLAVGDGYILQANTNRSFSNTSYEKKKEIEVNYGGQITVYFEYGVVGNSGNCYARVYKNGIAVGTEKSYYISTGTSVTQVWSENFTVNKGDLIQLYAKKSGLNTSFVANFKIGISGGLVGAVNLD